MCCWLGLMMGLLSSGSGPQPCPHSLGTSLLCSSSCSTWGTGSDGAGGCLLPRPAALPLSREGAGKALQGWRGVHGTCTPFLLQCGPSCVSRKLLPLCF